MERQYNFKCIVKGVRFYPGLALLRSSEVPVSLKLQRDYNNRHNANAIKVVVHENATTLGYLDRKLSSVLGP